MLTSLQESSKEYVATLKVDGEEWPISGTAISLDMDVRPEYRSLTDGTQFRTVTVKPKFVHLVSGAVYLYHSTKQPMIRVNFDDVDAKWLARLKHLKDANKQFEIQLLAFDSMYNDGVPLRPLYTQNTNIDPPTLLSTSPFLSKAYNVASSLERYGSYSYRVAAVIANDSVSSKVLSETRPSPRLYVGLDLIRDIDGNEINHENTVTIGWRHIAGIIAYKVYGRTPEMEKYLGTVTPGTAIKGDLLTFTDTGPDDFPENSFDTNSPYKIYTGSFETRWYDGDPSKFKVFVNGISVPFVMLDHNDVSCQAGSYCTVYTRYGIVDFDNPLLPTDEVSVRYIWEPKVSLDAIEPNPRAVRNVPLYSSRTPNIVQDEEGIKYDTTFQGLTHATRYSPNITLFAHEF